MGFLERFESVTLDTVFYHNSLKQYLIAVAVFFLTFLAAVIALRLVRASFRKLSDKTGNSLLSELLKGESRLEPIVKFIPVYVVAHYLTLASSVDFVIRTLWMLVLTWCGIRYVIWVVQIFSRQYVERNNFSPMIQHNINLFASVLLYCLGALFLLSNLGFNINTLIAGLGIGGMAIALAAQSILGDLFNYFTILLDKPFTVGDLVRAGNYIGHVERIGLKGTRVRALTGEEVIISNTDITKNTVQNYHLMEKRRQNLLITVKYGTPCDMIEKIPSILEEIVLNTDNTDFLRSYFASFTGGVYTFELVYYVLSKDYNMFMTANQQVNIAILREFERNGIEMAAPTSAVYLEGAKNIIKDS